MKRQRWAFQIGQRVRPRKEWRLATKQFAIPSGEVKAREPWANDGCYRIANDPHFWSAHVLEPDEDLSTRLQ